jgi:hypothetical protein
MHVKPLSGPLIAACADIVGRIGPQASHASIPMMAANTKSTKSTASREMIEGPEAWDRFRNAVKTALTVPKSAILENERKKARAKKKRSN